MIFWFGDMFRAGIMVRDRIRIRVNVRIRVSVILMFMARISIRACRRQMSMKTTIVRMVDWQDIPYATVTLFSRKPF